MKTLLCLAFGLVFVGCSHSRSIRQMRPQGGDAKIFGNKAVPVAQPTPLAENGQDALGLFEKRLEQAHRQLKELNEKAENKAEKAGKDFRKKLDELWSEQGALKEAWEKAKDKSDEALDRAGESLAEGLEAMEKSLKSLREKLE